MLNEWLQLGEMELGNNARTTGYQRTKGCPVRWIQDSPCETLESALFDQPYTYDFIDQAPWFDPDEPELSARFLGSYIVSMDFLSDSTRTASVVERLGPGAQVSGYRHASRRIRVSMILTAEGSEALEFGMLWLNSSLDPDGCGNPGVNCGSTEAEVFVDCPPPRGSETTNEGEIPWSDARYLESVNRMRRVLYDVRCVSGATVEWERKLNDGIHVGRMIEFTLIAKPSLYSRSREVVIGPSAPSVVQDVPYNLAPYPSAELASGILVTATNYATNPSLEVDAATWSGSAAGVAASTVTTGRTDELAASGSWSYRTRVVGSDSAGTATGTAMQVRNSTDVPMGALPAGSRPSVRIWAAAIAINGDQPSALRARVQWLGSSQQTLGTDELPAVPGGGLNGRVFADESLVPPAGATIARIVVEADVTYRATSNPTTSTDFRLYADAASVTLP